MAFFSPTLKTGVSKYVLMTEADGEGWQKQPEMRLP